MPPNGSVGEKIRVLRKKLKLTQAELAGNDFTKSYISQIEKGQTNPSLKSLSIIARRLGVPVSYLLGEEEESPANRDHLTALHQARLAVREGNVSRAIEKYLEAIDAFDENDHAGIGFTYLLLSETRAEQGTLDRAVHDAELAVEHLQLSHDYYNLARAHNVLGNLRARLNWHHEALRSFRSAIELFDDGRVRDTHLELRIRANLGITLSHLERHTESVAVLEAALAMMRSRHSYVEVGTIFQTLGYSYAALGELEKALSYTRRAIALYASLEQWDLLSSCQLNLGVFLHRSGDLPGARAAYEAIISPDSHASETSKGQAHFGLSEVALDEGRVEDAYEHLLKAFALASNYAYVSEWTTKVVECAKVEPVPPELLTQIEQLAATWKGDTRGLADIHSNLGKIYSLMGETQKANHHLSISVDLYRKS